MKKISLFLFLAGLTLNIYAQKTINDPNAEKRTVSGYHAIQVSHGIDLFLSQGDQETVAVSASEVKYRDRIRTEVVNGVLKIWYDSDKSIRMDWGNKKMKAYVSAKNIDGLSGSGGSDIEIFGTLKANQLKIDLSGGSDFQGKVEGSTITIEQSGGSDVSITGKVSTLKIDASGGSDFDGYDLISEYCEVEASGGSDVTITVNKELKANASGGSDVHYKGSASVKNAKSGGSTIKKVSK